MQCGGNEVNASLVLLKLKNEASYCKAVVSAQECNLDFPPMPVSVLD